MPQSTERVVTGQKMRKACAPLPPNNCRLHNAYYFCLFSHRGTFQVDISVSHLGCLMHMVLPFQLNTPHLIQMTPAAGMNNFL